MLRLHLRSPLAMACSVACLAAAWFGAGCATAPSATAVAKPGFGYIEFTAPGPDPLSWEIQRFDPGAIRFRKLFREFQPVEMPVVRVALPAGEHRLQINFLNLAIREPADFTVTVIEGHVTPVCLQMKDKGELLIESEQDRRGATYKGRYGRTTKYTISASRLYGVTAEPQPPQPCQPKTGGT